MYINVGKNSVNGSVDREQVQKSQENHDKPTFRIIHFKTACNQKTSLEHLACINSRGSTQTRIYLIRNSYPLKKKSSPVLLDGAKSI